MKTVGTLAVWAAVAVGCSWAISAAAATKTAQDRADEKLVEETLLQEEREEVDRLALLKPAIARESSCKAVYWLSGFVFDDKSKLWLAPDEMRQQSTKDRQLVAYRNVRQKYLETVEGQTELARWCSKRKLDDQSRAHWNRVLSIEPDHLEARRQLGFQMVDGKWMSQQEIAEGRSQAQELRASLFRWGPKLEEKLKRMAGPNPQAQEEARRELLAIDDPDALPAIEAILCMKGGDFALLGIEILKNIRAQQATGALAWHATVSPWLPIGQASATALRSKEKFDYVPLLLDAAQRPTGPQNQIAGGVPGNPGNYVVPDVRPIYRMESTSRVYVFRNYEHLNQHPNWRDVPAMRFDPKSPDPVAKNTKTVAVQGANTSTTQKKEYFTVKNDRMQDKVTETRVTTTRQRLVPIGTYTVPRSPQPMPYPAQAGGMSSSSDSTQQTAPFKALAEATEVHWPRTLAEWWQWWYDDNEVYPSAGDLPKAAAPADPPAKGGEETTAQRGDCLAGGALVCTETGLVPVEKIAVGDRLFCRDPETGELALKPVLRTTIRPVGRLLRIRVGGEEFEASGGQVFWVSGKGWVKARDLREGMRLHTVRGTSPVENAELGASQTTYGLATADFHTLFVGKAMVLAHDNTIRPPTDRLVPGLAISKENANPVNAKKSP